MQLSPLHRTSLCNRLEAEHFDLLVIGGGITGAGIALDAASRGLKTALIEKNDFAYGTSSRSTKLIHGGLRYLKQLEFGLVKEVGSERAIVHRIAPHLVLAEKMLLPLKEGRGFGSLLTSVGLKIYDWLAGVEPEDQRLMVNRKRTLELEPLLKPEGIKGGGYYAEYRTDDARLTIEILKSAASFGACLCNYVIATGFLYSDQQKVKGVEARDEISNLTFPIRASTIVNASGPWVDTLRILDKSKQGKELRLTKGVHIVVARKRFPVRQSIYFDVEDGRMIFAIPRGRTTYIGTTDTEYDNEIDDVVTTKEDAQYLIDAVNDSFPMVKLSMEDIESSWAGLRPLIHEEGRSAYELSRKDEIFESASGLISIAGGKLTGYRKMAERVTDMVIARAFKSRKLQKCYTDTIPLGGGTFKNTEEVNQYTTVMAQQLLQYGLAHYTDYLVHTYGKQTETILDYFIMLHDEQSDVRLALAEVWFTVTYEMVMTPLDFFIRRTGMLYFNLPRLIRVQEPVMKSFQAIFGWDDSMLMHQRYQLERAIQEAQIVSTNFTNNE
jgi:glycerol-3-phosphate dehydrogenase